MVNALLNPNAPLPNKTQYDFIGKSLAHSWLQNAYFYDGAIAFPPPSEISTKGKTLTADENMVLALGMTGVVEIAEALWLTDAEFKNTKNSLAEKLEIPEVDPKKVMTCITASAFEKGYARVTKTAAYNLKLDPREIATILHYLGRGLTGEEVQTFSGIGVQTQIKCARILKNNQLYTIPARYTFGYVTGILPLRNLAAIEETAIIKAS